MIPIRRNEPEGIRTLLRAVALIAACSAPAAARPMDDGPPPVREAPEVAGLRAPGVEARRAAALALREAGIDAQRAALPVLIDLVREEGDGQVRLAVLDTLTAMGPDAEPAVPALVHALRNPYGGRRMEQLHQDYRAAVALAAIGGPEAVEGLRALLVEERENIRAEAAMALGRIGPDAGPAVPDLAAMLGDDRDRIRQEAAIALGSIGPAAVPTLLDSAEHPDPAVRAAAADALGHLPEPLGGALEAVLDRTRDEAPEVRAAAVGALARWRPPESSLAAVLEHAVRERDGDVRASAIDLLAGRPELLRSMVPVLDSLLADDDEATARHAAFALHLLGPEAAPTLIDALGRPGGRIGPIAEALALIGRPIAGPIAEAAGDPDPRVRRGAALALGQIRPPTPDAVPRLSGGLDDPDPDVRSASLEALGALGPRAIEALPSVRPLLEDDSAGIRAGAVEALHRIAPRDDRLPLELASILERDDDPGVRLRAIETLRALGPRGRSALPSVIGSIRSDDPDVRRSAAELIAAHGPAAAEAVPSVAELLDDPDPDLRALAARTLASLGRSARPAFDRLVPLLDDPIAEVRGASALAMGGLELDAEDLRKPLGRALQDDDPDVRNAARRGIQRLGRGASRFLPALIESAALESDRRSAERSLRRFERSGPDEGTIPELVGLLDHDEEAVRLLAARFLGLAGPASLSAIPALERLGDDDPSPEVREQAREALDRILDDSADDSP